MRKITRRLTAAVLSACLAISPMAAFAEQPLTMPMAQVEIPTGDGAYMVLPVQSVITSTGETVFWLDVSTLTQEQMAALSSWQVLLSDETGAVLSTYFFGDETDAEGLVEIHDAFDPEVTAALMLAPMAMPEKKRCQEGCR